MIRGHGLACVLLAYMLLGGASVSALSGGAAGKASPRWGTSYFPNVPLVTHEGKSVHFFDDLIKGKVVMINFIYTSCPDSCPLETAQLLKVQKILGDRVGRDVFMYSISIDPKTDTPEVLKKYMELYGIGPGWEFLTGEEADITKLRKKLGLYIPEIQNGTNDHNLSMVIGNQATGQWKKSSPFENPYYLADQVGGWLHNWKTPTPGQLDYAHAPKLRDLSEGEKLYRTRCVACHTIGGGDIMEPEKRKIGPDLLGVVQMRDREWLNHWIAAPEKVLKEGDPIAIGLMAKYNNLPMPNMRLNQHEVGRLIDYLDEESQRVEKVKKMQAFTSSHGGGTTKSCCSMKKKDSVLAADKGKKDSVLAAGDMEPEQPTVKLSDKNVARIVKVRGSKVPTAEVQKPKVQHAKVQDQPVGFVTTPMIVFGILGLVLLLMARVVRQPR